MSEAKIALITGAGSGIGRATALLLHNNGYAVVLTGRRLEALEETAGMAGEGGGKMLAIATDIADPASVAAAFKKTRDEFGRLDLLFNNAGTSAPGVPMEELTPNEWQDVVNVNLNGTFYCAQEAIKIMLTRTISLDGRKDDIACGQIDIGNALTERTVRMTKGVPQADGSEKIEPVMTVDQVAEAVLFMDSLPLETNVQFMTIMATKMPFVGRG